MRRANAFRVACSIVVLTASAEADESKAKLVMTDVSTLAIDPGIDAKGLVNTPDGSTVAYPAKRGKKMVVFVEGKASPEYDGVGRIFLSEDGAHHAYWAKKDGAYGVVVVDGEERKVEGAALNVLEGIQMNRDGSHLAYLVKGAGSMRMVADGKAGAEFESAFWPRYSPDGKRLVYQARKAGGKQVVVIDGEVGPEYDGIMGGRGEIVFSADSKHTAYAGQRGDDWFPVIDGVEGKQPFKSVEQLTFSADGSKIAFVGRTVEGERAVLNGVVGDPFNLVSRLVFSPDGKRFAYAVRRAFRTPKDQDWAVIVDGTAGKTYSRVHTVAFSPDGKRLAYTAQQDDKTVAVIDDVPGSPYEIIVAKSVAFSPDGSRLAYVARAGGKWKLVVGNKESAAYDVVDETPRFSPDGVRTAVFVAKAGAAHLLVDDIESDKFEGTMGTPYFEGPSTLRAVIVRGSNFVRVRVEVVPAAR